MFEAFKIGVRLSLVNEVSHGLLQMANQFNHAETQVQRLRASIGAMSNSAKAMMGGALAIGVGVGLASMFKEPIEQANKYRKIQADILSNGAKGSQLGQIQAWAGNDKVLSNLSINEKMAIGAESFALTRDAGRESADETIKLAPILAKLESVAKNSGKEMSESDKANFTKILELGGGFNNGADINAMADKFYRLMASGNGTMKNGTLLSILKADPNDLNKMSDGAMARSEPLMQSMSSGFGVGLRMLDNRLMAHVGFGGGTGGKLYAQLKDIGVFDKNDKVIDSQLLTSDYDMWIRNHMQAFYDKAGAKTDADKRHIDYLIGGSSGAKLIQGVLRHSDQMDASGKSVIAQHGLDADAAQKGGPLDRVMTQIHTQWENILLRIGLKVLPTVLRGLEEFSRIMTGVSAWVKNNPGLTKFIALGTMVASGVLILGGTLAVLAGALALISWPITLAIAAIGGLIALGEYLHNINWGAIWDRIKNGFKSIFGGGTATQADKDYYAAAKGSSGQFAPGAAPSDTAFFRGANLPGQKLTPEQMAAVARSAAAASGSANIRTGAQSGATPAVNVYVDGKQVAAHVTKTVAQSMDRAGRGDSTTVPDYSAGMVNPGNS